MTDPNELSDQAKQAYEKGSYIVAADLFLQASKAYGNDSINAAEMMNNRSVALLQGGKAKEALEATGGTEEIFAKAGDLKRQGMAVGNRAAALEGLKRLNEALSEYDRAAALFEKAGEGDLHSMVRKAAANLNLKRGHINDTTMDVVDSLRLAEKPSLAQRLLKWFLRLRGY